MPVELEKAAFVAWRAMPTLQVGVIPFKPNRR